MNKLDIKKRSQIIAALVEGNSIRATCRMTGAAKGTVLKLLADVGQACSEYQDKVLSPMKSADSSVMVMSGHGRLFALILSSFLLGMSVAAICTQL
jgi:hypothetical protein